MSIQLTWENDNSDLTSIEIYRVDGKTIDFGSLPQPLAILTGSATDYIDTTAERNSFYTYAINAVKGTDSVFGDPLVMGYFPYTGPGSSTILRGDWNIGYFGHITPEEIATFHQLQGWIPNQDMVSEREPVLWHKFIFNDKFLFIPDTWYMNSVSLETIVDNGCLCGVNGTCADAGALSINVPDSPSNNTTPQNTTYINGGDSYYIKTPMAGNNAGAYTTSNNEIELISSLFKDCNLPSMHRVFDYTNTLSLNIHTQNRYNNTEQCLATATFGYTHGENTVHPSAIKAAWWPVLELLL